MSVGAIPLEVLFEDPQVIASSECEHYRGDIVRQGRFLIVRRSADHDSEAMLPQRAWFFSSDEDLELTLAQVLGAWDAA